VCKKKNVAAARTAHQTDEIKHVPVGDTEKKRVKLLEKRAAGTDAAAAEENV
jgi:hypothetical protein